MVVIDALDSSSLRQGAVTDMQVKIVPFGKRPQVSLQMFAAVANAVVQLPERLSDTKRSSAVQDAQHRVMPMPPINTMAVFIPGSVPRKSDHQAITHLHVT